MGVLRFRYVLAEGFSAELWKALQSFPLGRRISQCTAASMKEKAHKGFVWSKRFHSNAPSQICFI